MTPASIRFFAAAAACALVCAATAASAAPRDEVLRVRPRADGSVVVDGVVHQSWDAYYESDMFRLEGRRCGTAVPDPAIARRLPDSDCTDSSTNPADEYAPDGAIVIPVVWHVIETTGGTGDIPDDRIYSQMEILNEDYRALPGTPGADGTDARIAFVLASEDPAGNPTTGINRYVSDAYFDDPGSRANPMKDALAWDTSRYLNIYTNNAAGDLGYAFLPQQGLVGDPQDGVVLAHYAVGRDAPTMDYDQGRTATHEVGHYLGLHHTFRSPDSCPTGSPYSTGDLVADTIPERDPAFNCKETQTGCGTGLAQIDNYMNYTNDTCMTHFTAEQIRRMRCSTIHYRSDLFGTNAPPEPSFEVDQVDRAAAFTDASVDPDGQIASWSWDFGDGGTSTEMSPSHTYADTGTYTVRLTVEDERGLKSSTSQQVVANIAPAVSLSHSADGLTVSFSDDSSDEDGQIATRSWDFGDGTETSSEAAPVHTYAMAGAYTVTLTVVDDLGTERATSREIIADAGGCGCEVPGRNPRGAGLGGAAALALALGGGLWRLRRRPRA